MNNVPERCTNQPSTGQPLTSDLATNWAGVTLLTAKMSSHEMWLATNRRATWASGAGWPQLSCATFSKLSKARDHQHMKRLWTVWLKDGYTQAATKASPMCVARRPRRQLTSSTMIGDR